MSIINYGKKFGIKLMLILVVLIIILLITGSFNPDSIIVILADPLWFLPFLNSIAASIDGYSLAKNFNKEIKRLGVPT